MATAVVNKMGPSEPASRARAKKNFVFTTRQIIVSFGGDHYDAARSDGSEIFTAIQTNYEFIDTPNISSGLKDCGPIHFR
ncbi:MULTISPECIES: hypothetical protein [unclassified Serratia (in: enterobacteria)]|uniref:hypothetical protein n=1 Tax=unclassified Serratia (in: enterobacteria) TaxID=2647522 RepID=UPI003076331F